MKNIILTSIAILLTIITFAQEKGSFIDSRDGKTYKTVKIGSQTWFAENLAFKNGDGCWAYDNDPKNVEKYGYLYNLETARTSCPSGWHLPTFKDWEKLSKYIKKHDKTVTKGKYTIKNLGTALKSTSGWYENANGTDKFGFSALPAGNGANKYFSDKGKQAIWWCSEKLESDLGIFYAVYSDEDYLSSDAIDSNNGYSVRCVKD